MDCILMLEIDEVKNMAEAEALLDQVIEYITETVGNVVKSHSILR